MPKTRTLQEEIITALKTVGVVTKKDLKNYPTRHETKKMITEIVMQASDAILAGIDKILENLVTKNEFDQRFKHIETKVDNLSVDVHYIKDEIKNINTEISTFPTRSEFSKLKSQLGYQ